MPNTSGAAPSADGSTGGQGEAILSQSGAAIPPGAGNQSDRGWFSLHGWRPSFFLNTTAGYDDNIFYQQHKQGDFVSTIAPGIVFGWGDYRSLLPQVGAFAPEFQLPVSELTESRYFYVDYHPTIELFADHGNQDTVDEYLLASGSYNFSKLVFQGTLLYQKLSDAEIDAGTRVDRSLLTTTVTGSYAIDDKSSIDLTLSNFDAEYTGIYESSEDFRAVSFFNYQVESKTNVSAGVSLGYVVPEASPDQLYQQAVARVRWAGTDKLALVASGGIEIREVDGGRDLINPVFNFTLNYLPFDGTHLLLTGSRDAEPSDDELGNDIVTTTVGLGVQQRFLGRIFATGSVSFNDIDYQRLTSGSGVSRTDDTFEFGLTVGLDVTKYAGILLAFNYLTDTSTLTQRDFNDANVKVQLNLTY